MTAGAGAPAAVAQGVGAAAVGMSAAGNAYGSALRDGYSIGQARAYSTLVGAAEGTLQYILGGIGSLGGVTDDLIKAKINMIDNSLLRISAKLGVDVLSEISEEELQNFLEPAFRSIIFGEEYDAPTIDEMIETAIVTAGTTILLGGGDTVSGDLSENRQFVESGQKIMGIDGGLDTLMNSANEVLGLSSAQMQSMLTSQIDKVSQNPTARNVGQLNATVQAANNQAKTSAGQSNTTPQTMTNQTNTSINRADVAESLKGKGIPSQKIDTLAAAIVARVNGQELTRTQRDVLRYELGRPSVQKVINELIQKKSNGIDNAQSAVYDDSNIRDGLTDEEKTALWDLAHQQVGVFSNHAYATATEDSAIDQSKGASSKGVFDGGLDASIKNIDYFIEGTKSFDDVLDDYAKVYADKINSNQLWSWEDTIPGGENLTPKQRSIIKQQAVDAGLIPDIRVTKVEGMRYGFADFESAEVVMKTQYLPENMWKMSDAEQFKWLNEQNGGSVEGYTWHHTETPGEMQLVPTGIHNITTHNGGRTAGMWADSPR